MTSEKKLAKRGRGGILADQMGLGKTIMTLSLIKKYPTLQSVVNENIIDKSGSHHTSNKHNVFNDKQNNFLKTDLTSDPINNSINKSISLINNNSLNTSIDNTNFKVDNKFCVCMDCIKSKLQLDDNVVLGGTLIILPTSILDQWQLEISSLIGSQLR